MPLPDDPVRKRHRDLEKIANATLRLRRDLMECGACVRVVHSVAMAMTASILLLVPGVPATNA